MSVGFFAVFDDIAMLLDDAAAMSKVAAKKTAAVLGDDLAVGAQKASGFSASRELPVLWAITKGSFKNKLIILPFAFLLSAYVPWIIVPILMIGGLYLAFEGAEKIYEYFVPHPNKKPKFDAQNTEAFLEYEAKKVKGAILTDFILSIEIIIIALNTVLLESLPIQIIVVTLIAVLATIGVYGFVALLVRMDDVGFKMIAYSNKKGIINTLGNILVQALPRVITFLTVVGTLAMLLVAGGIFVHHIEALHHFLQVLPNLLAELITGVVLGFIVLTFYNIINTLRKTTSE